MKSRIILVFLVLLVPVHLFADKPVVTVMDFQANSVSLSDMKSITSFLSASLHDTGKYTVIDTAQRDMILEELAFSNSGCTDESCQLEIGKLLSAEYIVTGDIALVSGRYILSARMLETETSATVNTAKGIYKDLGVLIDDMPLYAQELSGEDVDRTAAADSGQSQSSVRNISGKEIAAWSTLGGGAVAAGIGGYLLYAAFDYKTDNVDPAFNLYNSARLDTNPAAAGEYYDSLWADYENEYSVFTGKLIVSSILAGTGIASMLTSAVLFVLNNKENDTGEKTGSMETAFFFLPGPETAMLSCRIRM